MLAREKIGGWPKLDFWIVQYSGHAQKSVFEGCIHRNIYSLKRAGMKNDKTIVKK